MILDLPITPILSLLFGLHCVIGIIAAIIAQNKGLNFRRWLILGLIGGTVALIAVLVNPSKTQL